MQHRDIPCTAAVRILEAVLDRLVIGVGVFVEQGLGLQDQSRRAKATLCGPLHHKGLLQRVQLLQRVNRAGGFVVLLLPCVRQPFNGEDACPLRLKGRVDA